MKTSVILALFSFVLAVGFSVAVTENELADMADDFQAEKLRGGYYMIANDGEFDEEDQEDEDMAIPSSENDMATEDGQFDETAFVNDDDGDEVGDEDDVRAVEKSADPIRFRRFRRAIRRIGRRLRRTLRRGIRRIRLRVRGVGRAIRRFRRS